MEKDANINQRILENGDQDGGGVGNMDKEDVVHIYNRILLSHKIEQNNSLCRNMDRPRDCHIEWS